MQFGNRDLCSIELEITRDVDQLLLGRFLLWAEGRRIGDPDDESVHIKGCLGWLRDFVAKPRNRCETGLFELPKEEVFRTLCSGVFASEIELLDSHEMYEDTFERFHISHLGMSSFDQTTLLLVEDEQGNQRLIWQQGTAPIDEAFLPPRELQRVATSVVMSFE
jgi:hypothetical protein